MIEEDLNALWHSLIEMARIMSEEGRTEEAGRILRYAERVRRARDMCRAERAKEVFELAMLSIVGAGEDMEEFSRKVSRFNYLTESEKELYASLINILGEFMSDESE